MSINQASTQLDSQESFDSVELNSQNTNIIRENKMSTNNKSAQFSSQASLDLVELSDSDLESIAGGARRKKRGPR